MKSGHRTLKRFRRVQMGFAGAVIFASCGCTHLATVKNTRATLPAVTESNQQLQVARQRLIAAEREQPLTSLGDDLSAAKLSLNVLEQRPNDLSAQGIYN